MTLYTNLMERCKYDDGSRRIFGWREVDKATGEAGPFVWVSYKQFLEQVEALAGGMANELGLKRQEPVGLFSKNRYEWVLVEHGSSRMAYQLVPLYDTLGPTAIPYKPLIEVIDQCPTVKTIVQFEDVTGVERAAASA